MRTCSERSSRCCGRTTTVRAGPWPSRPARTTPRPRGPRSARTSPRAWTPPTVDYLDSTLHAACRRRTASPSWRASKRRSAPSYRAKGLVASFSIGCELFGRGPRRDPAIAVGETPELRAQVEALLAPYGDEVRCGSACRAGLQPAVGGYVPAAAAAGHASPGTAADAEGCATTSRSRRTSRCVRGGTLKVKRRSRTSSGSRSPIGMRAACSRGTARPRSSSSSPAARKVAVTVDAQGRPARATQTLTLPPLRELDARR